MPHHPQRDQKLLQLETLQETDQGPFYTNYSTDWMDLNWQQSYNGRQTLIENSRITNK